MVVNLIAESQSYFNPAIKIRNGQTRPLKGIHSAFKMVAMDEARKDSSKCSNDPWAPLPDGSASSQHLIAPAPENPLSQMIDSERYIQSLERKLAQLSKVRKGEPSSRDIITSLALFHDDQMRRYISETDIIDFGLASCSRSDEALPQSSFVQRKLHPEKQPLNAEEIAELVKEDVLAKVFEETLSNTPSEIVPNNVDQHPQISHVSESSESPVDLHHTSTVDGTQTQSFPEVDLTATVELAQEDWANFDEFV